MCIYDGTHTCNLVEIWDFKSIRRDKHDCIIVVTCNVAHRSIRALYTCIVLKAPIASFLQNFAGFSTLIISYWSPCLCSTSRVVRRIFCNRRFPGLNYAGETFFQNIVFFGKAWIKCVLSKPVCELFFSSVSQIIVLKYLN